MACTATLQKLVDTDYRIALINTHDSERMVYLFHRFSMETGCAVYEWDSEAGLNRMGFQHIMIPQTRTPKEILTYIHNARHFGIYLFQNFKHLDDREIEELLYKIQHKKDGVRRLMVFIGSKGELSQRIATHAAKIDHRTKPKHKEVSEIPNNTVPFPRAVNNS